MAVCPRIWKAYNSQVLANEPALDFPKPEGLVYVNICLESGKLSGPYCPPNQQRRATFWSKDVPTDNCDIHQPGDELKDNEGELPDNGE